jgi:hypothetical protein
MDTAASAYVFAHYVNQYGLCDLCANTGIVDTTGATSPAGVVCGGRHFCLCPNGQALRDANAVHRAHA